jgi:hypothetical protein
MEQMIIGGPEGANTKYPIYDYCTKYNKPLIMAEGGVAFHETYQGAVVDVGPGRTAIYKGFWTSFLNPTFLDKYNKFKAFIFFEHVKRNEDASQVDNDYRIATFPDTLAAFKSDLSALGSRAVWSSKYQPGVDVLTLGGASGSNTTTGSGSGSGSGTGGKSAGVREKAASFAAILVAIGFSVALC